MGAPTDKDWESFRSTNQRDKIDALYDYVCEGSGSMQDIARRIFGSEDSSWTVSMITRCYGFEGHNKGKFRKIGATREDVAAFVRAYPSGTEYDGKGYVMEEFLRNRVASRNNTPQFVNNMTNTQSNYQPRNRSVRQTTPHQNTGGSSNQFADGIDSKVVGIIIAIILLFLFREQIFGLLEGILPVVIILGLVVIFFKAVFNGGLHLNKPSTPRNSNMGRGNSGRKSGGINLSLGNIVVAGIFFYIGIGGFMNGGNIIITLVFCAFGVAVLKS